MTHPESSAYHVVIPARFDSERLPGKVLLDLEGCTMLQRVWQQACSSGAESVVIATDDERVASRASSFGAQVVMTSPDNRSGSDRIAECAELLGWEDDRLVVNLQGDEPLMPPACLEQVAMLLSQHPDCEVASLYWPITDADEALDPNVVKVVTDDLGRALYFSRAPIPFVRAYADVYEALLAGIEYKRHLGLYAYRVKALRSFSRCGATPLETAERLEQLRVMELGGRIAMARAREFIPAGVDTPDDLARVRQIIKSKLL